MLMGSAARTVQPAISSLEYLPDGGTRQSTAGAGSRRSESIPKAGVAIQSQHMPARSEDGQSVMELSDSWGICAGQAGRRAFVAGAGPVANAWGAVEGRISLS